MGIESWEINAPAFSREASITVFRKRIFGRGVSMRTTFLHLTTVLRGFSSLVLVGLLGSGAGIAQERPLLKKEERALAAAEKLQEEQRQTELIARLGERLAECDQAGDRKGRELVLKEAEAEWGADDPRIRSLRGEVEVKGEWLTPEQVASRSQSSPLKYQYVSQRGQMPDDMASHTALARTASGLGLDNEARAHLLRLLDYDSENQEVRRQLGHVELGGTWMTPETRAKVQTEMERRTTLIQKGSESISKIRRLLLNRRTASREEAISLLSKVNDPDMALAVEMMICTLPSPDSLLGLKKLGEWESEDATAALLRSAMFLNDAESRKLALELLKDRDTAAFIPELLALLETPVISQFQLVETGFGGLLHRHVFVQQKMDQDLIRQYDSSYQVNLSDLALNRFSTQAVSVAAEENSSAGRERIVDFESRRRAYNQFVAERNQFVMELLSELTGERPGRDPASWWKWWEEKHEYRYSQRPVSYRTRNLGTTITRVWLTPSTPGRDSGSRPRVPVNSSECFVAGTLVWTDCGLNPIEKLTTGDRVLSKDLQTGRLIYRNVIRPTQREAASTFDVCIGGETFRASGGHPFQVFGVGWVQARNLEPGMPVIARSGTVLVESVTPAKPAPLFNVVVEGESNYFVGTMGVLTHDNTIPKMPVRDPGTVE
jgi:hypothetical protein